MYNKTSPIYLVLSVLLLISCSQKQKFDSVKWKAYQSYEPGDKIRYKMVDDLVKSEILIKKNKIEIIDILGSEYNDSSEIGMSYPVYEYYGFDIDPTYYTQLNIFFKDNYCYRAEHEVVFDRR